MCLQVLPRDTTKSGLITEIPLPSHLWSAACFKAERQPIRADRCLLTVATNKNLCNGSRCVTKIFPSVPATAYPFRTTSVDVIRAAWTRMKVRRVHCALPTVLSAAVRKISATSVFPHRWNQSSTTSTQRPRGTSLRFHPRRRREYRAPRLRAPLPKLRPTPASYELWRFSTPPAPRRRWCENLSRICCPAIIRNLPSTHPKPPLLTRNGHKLSRFNNNLQLPLHSFCQIAPQEWMDQTKKTWKLILLSHPHFVPPPILLDWLMLIHSRPTTEAVLSNVLDLPSKSQALFVASLRDSRARVSRGGFKHAGHIRPATAFYAACNAFR